ncbi:Dicer-like protein 1 [Coemansia javaensis]|uniref:Dicer-like protein 1 n=1 Tax=Coemansia javaensis TaxID=2761396 RepID=A0A9W8HIQ3_9FUNG|nr:Dicer-like protein 1 [Coemansia javaensis]
MAAPETDAASAPAPELAPNTHTPREYQLSLFRRALATNSIVMLETGTGKTLVAVMLIQWFAQRAKELEAARGNEEAKAGNEEPKDDDDDKKPPEGDAMVLEDGEVAEDGQAAKPAEPARTRSRRKIRVFLNTTVALVHQQARVIAANTDQTVQECVGSMGIEDWGEAVWSAKWASAGVLVMTHQVLLNALRAGFVRISDIDLLVFDECHHARGNHPYTLIMREFYDHCPKADRPHIFGMTASPLNARQTAEASVEHLQASLDSDICTVDLTAGSGTAQTAPAGVCYEYKLPPEFPDTALTLALVQACSGSSIVTRGQGNVPTILALLGPFAVDQMWYYYVRQWHRSAIMRPAPSRQAIPSAFAQPSSKARPAIGAANKDDPKAAAGSDSDGDGNAAGTGLRPATVDPNTDPLMDITFLKRALEVVREHGGAHLGIGTREAIAAAAAEAEEAAVRAGGPVHPVPHIRALSTQRRPWAELRSQLTPQVNRLLGILLQWRERPEELRGIVFANRRITAVLLVYIISQITEFDFIRADVLLGSSQKAGSNIDRPIRGGSARTAGHLTLTDFADGKLNLVFATQVAEEGVDVQPCNLVIRFDMPKTATSLIQSRGRARMANSQFIVMVPEIDDEQRMSMDDSVAPVVPCGDSDDDDSPANTTDDHTAPDPPCAMEVDGEVKAEEAKAEEGAEGGDPERRLLPEHSGTYTDYLRLVGLEECLREWCRLESQANDNGGSDGVIISSRRHEDYNRALLSLRSSLRIDDSPSTDLSEIWLEKHDRSGLVYVIQSTDARITYMSAISIVNTYVQRLPQDLYCKLVPVVTFEEVMEADAEAAQPGSGAPDAALAQVETEPALAQTETEPALAQIEPEPALAQIEPEPALAQTEIGAVEAEPALAQAELEAHPDPTQPKKKRKVEPAAKKPKGRVLFRCTFTLPSNAAIRRVSGPLMPSKKLAKQVAAYRLAKKLHQLGAIDDNLMPVVEATEAVPGNNALPGKGSKRANKGVRASTESYVIATASHLLPPTAKTDLFARLGAEAGAVGGAADAADPDGEPAVYHPIPWHAYMFTLKHPQTAAPTLMALMTTKQLPEDLELPLFVDQFAKTDGPPSTDAMPMRPVYMGSRVLDEAQVRALSSFSAHIMVRVLHMALVCEPHEIGCLLAPMLEDSSDIDLAFAESCFADRTICYKEESRDYSDLVGTVLMDGLDGANMKIVQKVCDGMDIYSDVRSYHTQLVRASQPPPPPQPPRSQDGTEQKEAAAPKVGRKREEKSKMAVRSVADWSNIKRVQRLLPPKEYGRAVPLFSVKHVQLTLNYLSIASSTADGAGDDGEKGDPSSAAVAAAAASKAADAYPDGLYTSPFFCARDPVTLDDLHNLSLLPALFFRLEQVLLAEDVKTKLGLPAARESVREALTSSSANIDVCYERLETLGDSVLKYITTVMVFVAYPDAHEGILTSRRGRIICNANLFDLATNIGLPPYIISQLFVKRDARLPGPGWKRLQFIPSKWICESRFFRTPKSDPAAAGDGKAPQKPARPPAKPMSIKTEQVLSEKTVADTIESLLGACVRDGGIEGALTAARRLGVVDGAWKTWSSFYSVWRSNMDMRRRKMARLDELRNEMISAVGVSEEAESILQEMQLEQADVIFGIDSHRLLDASDPGFSGRGPASRVGGSAVLAIEAMLGYTFRDRTLLNEALTHCSSLDLSSTSYQRLEFLGDAVLDYLVTERYYNFQPPLSPHRITLVKHVASSNDLFALVLVCHGLHQFIQHSSPVIRDVIHDYELRLAHARETWAKGLASHNSADEEGSGSGGDAEVIVPEAEVEAVQEPEEQDQFGRPTKRLKIEHADDGSRSDRAGDVFKDLPPECWNIVQAPKVLGDVFESLVGAVFVDSGMDHEATKRVYERILSPFLDRFVDTGKLSLHPVIQCLLICQGWGCNVLTWEGRTSDNQLEYAEKYICELKAHGHTISVAAGESPRHAKFNAASALLDKIGAEAPNAIDGNMRTMHNLPSIASAPDGTEVSMLDNLLKPVCNCAELRQEEAEKRAAAEEERRLAEEAAAAGGAEEGEIAADG